MAHFKVYDGEHPCWALSSHNDLQPVVSVLLLGGPAGPEIGDFTNLQIILYVHICQQS